MDRSATWRIAPARLFIDSILDDRGNGTVAIRERKHLGLARLIGLGVVFGELNPVTVVMIAGRLAVWTTRLCVHHYRHCSNLHLLSTIDTVGTRTFYGARRHTEALRKAHRDR